MISFSNQWCYVNVMTISCWVLKYNWYRFIEYQSNTGKNLEIPRKITVFIHFPVISEANTGKFDILLPITVKNIRYFRVFHRYWRKIYLFHPCARVWDVRNRHIGLWILNARHCKDFGIFRFQLNKISHNHVFERGIQTIQRIPMSHRLCPINRVITLSISEPFHNSFSLF